MPAVTSPTGLIGGIANAAQATSRFLPEPIARGVEFASRLAQGEQRSLVDISPEYRALIERQIETQAELQQVTFTSNIERSQHESRMAAVRNIRVS